ncbi:MAG: cobalamin-dependent protein [Planctomycetes bacterium]|nr:cobalamin-dependent protein [Planctomycetota bacterium]
MDKTGMFLASLLDASSKAYAAGAVSRLRDESGAAAEAVRDWNYGLLVDDAETRLHHLAEAVAAGRPELFESETVWTRELHAAQGVPVHVLRGMLQSLRDELDESLPPAQVGLAHATLERALRVTETPATRTPSYLDPQAPYAEETARFLVAVLEGRTDDATQIVLDVQDQGAALGTIHTEILGRAQSEMGRMWQVGEVDVADEHLGSRVVEDLLVLLRANAKKAPRIGKRVLMAAISGNMHDIGARMIADQFIEAGWDTLFLGSDVPGVDLARAAVDHDVDLVALSVGISLNLRATAREIEAIRTATDGTVPVLVGGRPFRDHRDLHIAVGADASAGSAKGALQRAAELVGLD